METNKTKTVMLRGVRADSLATGETIAEFERIENVRYVSAIASQTEPGRFDVEVIPQPINTKAG